MVVEPAVVAPLVGAWIEITLIINMDSVIRSLLSWERGLKFVQNEYDADEVESLLSWERGLKFLSACFLALSRSRSSRGSVD